MSKLQVQGETDACRLPNSHKTVTISRSDLPLHCPQEGECQWNSHPRVFLDIEDAPDHRIICPYCSTVYQLEDT